LSLDLLTESSLDAREATSLCQRQSENYRYTAQNVESFHHQQQLGDERVQSDDENLQLIQQANAEHQDNMNIGPWMVGQFPPMHPPSTPYAPISTISANIPSHSCPTDANITDPTTTLRFPARGPSTALRWQAPVTTTNTPMPQTGEPPFNLDESDGNHHNGMIRPTQRPADWRRMEPTEEWLKTLTKHWHKKWPGSTVQFDRLPRNYHLWEMTTQTAKAFHLVYAFGHPGNKGWYLRSPKQLCNHYMYWLQNNRNSAGCLCEACRKET
jgi:hypothetical protein